MRKDSLLKICTMIFRIMYSNKKIEELRTLLTGSTGGVSWLKLLIFIGIIYLIGGCIYNQLNFGKKGVDAIPHLDFWRALPTIIVEGCKYVIGKIKTLTSKYSPESTTSGGSRPKASGGYLNL